MPDENDKIIQEQFKKLPSDVKSMLLSPDFEKNINLIRERHDIPIDKEIPLQNEIFLLTLGLSDPEEFEGQLSESLDIPREEAGVVIRDIDRMILGPVKNSLVAFLQREDGAPNETSARKTEESDHEPTPNLPVIEPHLEPMIVEPGTPFLPPLRKNISVSKPVEPVPTAIASAPTPQTLQQKEVPRFNPALSNEISNLLRQKMKEDITKTAPALLHTTPQSRPEQIPPENLPVEPATRPEDKLGGIVSSPKTKIALERVPLAEKKESDPYREPIE